MGRVVSLEDQGNAVVTTSLTDGYGLSAGLKWVNLYVARTKF